MLEQACRSSFGVISLVIIMEYIKLNSLREKNKTIKKGVRAKDHGWEITHTSLLMTDVWSVLLLDFLV